MCVGVERSRVLPVLALLLTASPGVALSQSDQVRQVDRGWLGCWTIATHESVPGLPRALHVRLDSNPTYRGPPPNYYGTVLDGPAASARSWQSVSWGAPTKDSLLVTIIGLGGHKWRFQRSADTLTGLTYRYYDVIPDETVLGRASARRAPCP